ncbi:MmyB family transcriptional regulator [Amycolatopsis samaneae]|uniref:MmyB-like transcription regulator ligand binding domain-containing protein n=1 Tax=Amycolatopsis samaneae TaxID=664691 RepID=A0ABW5GGS7_9PSEU
MLNWAIFLVSSLARRDSPEFAVLWERHDVAVRRDDRKRIVHASLGVVEVNCLNLFSENGRQRPVWFTPPSAPTPSSSSNCSPYSAHRTSPRCNEQRERAEGLPWNRARRQSPAPRRT